MTTPTLSTIAGLRRAVCAHPHDDTARLVLADALDESGGEMQAKWAELIRLQIRMASLRAQCRCGACVKPGQQHHNSSCDVDKERDELPDGRSKPAMLRARESTLLRELTPWLRRGERCERVLWGSCGHECPTCHGTGWLGSLASVPDARTTFLRGLVARVELTAAQVQDAAFLARLFGEWPVTEAGLIGKEPGGFSQSYDEPRFRGCFCWYRGYDPVLPSAASDVLPSVIFDAISGARLTAVGNWKLFPTAEAANAALSRAIIALGRTAAGLPQIGEAP